MMILWGVVFVHTTANHQDDCVGIQRLCTSIKSEEVGPQLKCSKRHLINVIKTVSLPYSVLEIFATDKYDAFFFAKCPLFLIRSPVQSFRNRVHCCNLDDL